MKSLFIFALLFVVFAFIPISTGTVTSQPVRRQTPNSQLKHCPPGYHCPQQGYQVPKPHPNVQHPRPQPAVHHPKPQQNTHYPKPQPQAHHPNRPNVNYNSKPHYPSHPNTNVHHPHPAPQGSIHHSNYAKPQPNIHHPIHHTPIHSSGPQIHHPSHYPHSGPQMHHPNGPRPDSHNLHGPRPNIHHPNGPRPDIHHQNGPNQDIDHPHSHDQKPDLHHPKPDEHHPKPEDHKPKADNHNPKNDKPKSNDSNSGPTAGPGSSSSPSPQPDSNSGPQTQPDNQPPQQDSANGSPCKVPATRQGIVAAAMWAAKSGKYINYSQGGSRWSGITKKTCPYQGVPAVTDCSAFVTWLYWSAFGNGKDFLNNQGWKAGYTGSMGSNGTPVSLAQAKPGDVVLYGSHPYHHATLYVGNNQVVSFGANGPAKLLPINYRGDYHVRSYLP